MGQTLSLFSWRRPAPPPDRQHGLPSCIDSSPGCSSFVVVMSCKASPGGIASAVPEWVLKWYHEPAAVRRLGHRTMADMCPLSCGACSAVAVPNGRPPKAVASRTQVAGAVGTVRAPLQVGMVMPLHPPKFGRCLTFVRSLFACKQRSRYPFFPVFSAAADQHSFHQALVDSGLGGAATMQADGHGVYHAVVVEPDPRNPVTSKKLAALRFVLGDLGLPYALAVDAEVEFQTRHPFLDAFAEWHRRREFVAWRWPSNVPTLQWRNISRASCAFVGGGGRAAASEGWLSWWSDAPIFSRDDFEDFFGRLRWERLSWYVYDHEAYMCYKRAARGWTVRESSRQLENADSAVQALEVGNHTFLWSRDRVNASSRLLRFHLDRRHVIGPAGKYRLPRTHASDRHNGIRHSQRCGESE